MRVKGIGSQSHISSARHRKHSNEQTPSTRKPLNASRRCPIPIPVPDVPSHTCSHTFFFWPCSSRSSILVFRCPCSFAVHLTRCLPTVIQFRYTRLGRRFVRVRSIAASIIAHGKSSEASRQERKWVHTIHLAVGIPVRSAVGS